MIEPKLIRALLVPLNWCFVDQGQGKKWSQNWNIQISKKWKGKFQLWWYGKSLDMISLAPYWLVHSQGSAQADIGPYSPPAGLRNSLIV